MTSRIRVPVKTVNQPYTGHCRTMPPTTERLLWPAHTSQDFLGEATTTSRLPFGLLNPSPALLRTSWYKVFLRRDQAIQRFTDLYADRSGCFYVSRVKGRTVTTA